MSRTKSYALLVLLLLAAFLRVETIRLTEVVNPLRADAHDYVLYAYNLVNYGVYSRSDSGRRDGIVPTADAARAPGYPAFILPFVATLEFDRALESVKWAQALLSFLSVILAMLLARWCLPWWPALGVGFLTAISPHLLNANVYWLTESLFTFQLLLILILFALMLRSSRALLFSVLCGLCFGWCYLTRPTIILFMVPLIGLVFLHQRPRWLHLCAPLALCALVVPLLWAVATGPSGDVGGGSLLLGSIHHGMYPDFIYADQPGSVGFPYRADPRAQEIAANWPSLLTELQRRFTDETGRHVYWFLIGKPLTLLSWDIIQGMGGSFIYPVRESPFFNTAPFNSLHLLAGILHLPTTVLALLGCALTGLASWKKWLPASSLLVPQLASLLLLYFIAIHMVVAPFPRYAIPLRPVCYLLGVWSCWGLWQYLLVVVRKDGTPAHA